MNRIELWKKINHYSREGVISPIVGDYIVPGDQFCFKADLLGSMLLAYIGPTNWGPKEMPTIEPGVIADLIKIYSAREVALLECAYECKIFGWSRDYLSENDVKIIDDWIVRNDAPVNVMERFKFFVDKLVRLDGDIVACLAT